MRVLGFITAGVAIIVVVGLVVVLVMSIPDIRRYRRIRSM
jgi:hypothetical protein